MAGAGGAWRSPGHGSRHEGVGATTGMVAANLVAVSVGRQLGARLSPRVIRIGSALLFALAGGLVLVGALAA